MKIFKIIILITYFIQCSMNSIYAVEKFKIITTNIYIGSIVKSLVDDLAIVESLEANASGCSHSFQFTIKDLVKTRSADLVIYVDENFETYITKLLSSSSIRSIKLSNIHGIRLLSNGPMTNWYMWYNISNTKIIAGYILKALQQNLVNHKEQIYQNYKILMKQLLDIEHKYNALLAKLPDNVVIIDNALAYFFKSETEKITNIAVDCHNYMSFSILQQINRLAQQQNLYVILGDKVEIKKWQTLFDNKVQILQVKIPNFIHQDIDKMEGVLIITLFDQIIDQLYNLF